MQRPDAERVTYPTRDPRASSTRAARRRAARLALLLAAPLILHTLAAGMPPAAAAETWVPLFDGQTLAGWEGRTDVFRVEDGAIMAGSRTAPMPRNEFLCTLAEYGDFVLRLEFHMPGDGMNAGVQFRWRRIPDNHEVIGYQADMGDGWWGALYDESRRNRLLAKPDDEVIARALDKEGWNQYAIDVRGRRVRLFINDHLSVDYTEPDATIEPRGRICLQIHSGPPGEVRYRNIEIRELAPGPQVHVPPGTVLAQTSLRRSRGTSQTCDSAGTACPVLDVQYETSVEARLHYDGRSEHPCDPPDAPILKRPGALTATACGNRPPSR